MLSRSLDVFTTWHLSTLVSFLVTSAFLFPTSADTFYRDSDDCFKLIASGRRAAPRFIQNTLSSRSLEDCEEECLRASSFICRGFNYRPGSSSLSYSRNCELSSQDTYGADIDDHSDFRRDSQFDFHERKSFSRECNGAYISRNGNRDYGRYPIGNIHYAFSHRANTDRGPFTGYTNNVWLNSGRRYNSDRYGNDYDNNNYNPYYGNKCFRLFRTKTTFEPRVVAYRLRVRDLKECERECLRRRFCRTLAFSYTSYWSRWPIDDNCYLSNYEAYSLDHSQLYYEDAFDMYSLDDYNSRYCHRDPGWGFPDWDYPTYREERYETASGLRCYRDSCRLDRQGKYYFCETDTNGGWDYCCAPGKYCQQYHGSQLKTCEVGTRNEGQWRPCDISSGFRRAYLTSDDLPNASKRLADPVPKIVKKESEDKDHPIEVSDITDLGK